MELLKFLRKESGTLGYLFVFLGILSGLANAGLLKLINNVISDLSLSDKYQLNIKSIGLYLIVVIVLIFSQRIFSKYIITLTQKIICKIQLEILEKIRLSNYDNFKSIGSERIYSSLTQDAGVISSVAASIVYACTSLVTVVFCLCYLAYVSLIGFSLTLFVIGVAVTIYILRQKAIEIGLTKARELQNTFFKFINDLLSGYKEMKVNHQKSDDLYQNYIKKNSMKVKDLSTKAIVSYLDNSLTGQLSFFLLIGFILFYFPFIVTNHQVVISYIFIILYILGPLEGLMTTIPGITQANIAIKNITALQAQATSLNSHSSAGSFPEKQFTFDKIVFDQVSFSYSGNNEDSFTVGPINMEVNKGELLFIVGGNGCGKTTLFKILTGLYYPQNGSIKVNGKTVTDFTGYRSLFSPIYSDFYLFDRFYGMNDVNAGKVNEYIEIMQLAEKVTFSEGRFSKTDFSTGQRKRLALIVSLLEERPVLVLDEWAADQDPLFRKFFYETFLPELKQKGKTIIAITHDDKYFHLADRMYKMEYGKLYEQPILMHS